MLPKLTRVMVLFTIGACSRSSPGPEPLPLPSGESPVPAVETPTGSRSWTFTRDARPQRYSTVARTTLELRTDTAAIREELETATSFTLAIAAESTPPMVSGSIDEMKLSGSGRAAQESSSGFQPFAFSGRIENGALELDSAGGSVFQTLTACDSPGLNAVTALSRSIVALPRSITSGMTWTDSSTVSGCSGSIPVQLTAVRSYRVVGETRESGPGVVAIDRTDRVRAAGEGSQGQHRVVVQATGSGSSRILVDKISGVLSGMEGEQKADVIITASGRSQHFLQTVKDKTVLRGSAF